LYDAVECQGVDFDVVLELACHTEIAVYDGIASKCHPTAALSEQLDNEGVSADNRHYLLQAILLSTIS
jgi:ornithine carbamoyltransferase